MPVGLLVVARSRWFDDKRILTMTGPPRQPSIDLRHEEILRRYRGIDGDSWPKGAGQPEVPLGSDGLVSLSMVDEVRQYFEDVSNRQLCDMLVCESPVTNHEVCAPPGFSFCGYDVSPGTNDLTNYSVVYNEVIYGLYQELREWSAQLNEHLLVSALPDVERLLELRERLGRNGADLEDGGHRRAMAIIAIHAVNRVPHEGT